jgi:hypothetical protein
MPYRLRHGIHQVLKIIRPTTSLDRITLSKFYLSGKGIEIGALHFPLPVNRRTSVTYVDRVPTATMRMRLPELASAMVDVDIIDDGEVLSTISDASQDFVIANHFLEHTQNPIGTLNTLLRVIRRNGILYLSLPDKRYTFDIDRPITPTEHIIRDFKEGPGWSMLDHYREWVNLVDKVTDATLAKDKVESLIASKEAIHFHVWTQQEMLDMLASARALLSFSFEIEAFLKNGIECIFIIRRT